MRNQMLRIPLIWLFAAATLVAQTQTPPWPREPDQPDAPKPLPAARAVAELVGEYEARGDSNGSVSRLYLLEKDGRLWSIVDRGSAQPALDVKAVRGPESKVTGVLRDGVTFSRLQVGPADGGQLRINPVRPVKDVLTESMSATPPREAGTFTPADLVELTMLDRTIKLDIRYATTNNFLGAVFYAAPRAFLQRPAAESLVRAHRALKPLGYGLLVHDGYRPWYVTRTFWECTPQDKKWLVADPSSGSKHNRGAAVDLTLYDLKTGAVIEMPSTYDESTPRAYAFYPGGTGLQRWHRALLRRLMEAEGFIVNPEEWWHFDYRDWKNYAIGNVTFDRIR
jgi:D-alanyl-D-alanine dipeptidase